MLPYLELKSHYKLMLFIAGGARLAVFRVKGTREIDQYEAKPGGSLSQILERSSKCFSLFSFPVKIRFFLTRESP